MAKQRGIHQISGKINNLCYYQQKYVPGGLIRRINEAMSERLKIDPVFANTRVANTIFGGCSMVAGALLEFFGNRNTFLFKPYRQAILTRAVKKYFINEPNSSGYPTISSQEDIFKFLPSIISTIVKNSIFNDFTELENYILDLSLNDSKEFIFNYDSLANFCKKNHCIGVQLSITKANYIYSTSYDLENGAYILGDYNPGGRFSSSNWFLNQDVDTLTLSASTGDIDDAGTFWIIYANPIVSSNNGRPVFGRTGASCGVITFKAM